MRLRGAALIREVELHCGRRCWVFARTLIPAKTLEGGAKRLAYLRARPLGAVLFADPNVRRDLVEVARLSPNHILFECAARGLLPAPDSLWARRTRFLIDDKPLLVNEVFLPDLPSRT